VVPRLDKRRAWVIPHSTSRRSGTPAEHAAAAASARGGGGRMQTSVAANLSRGAASTFAPSTSRRSPQQTTAVLRGGASRPTPLRAQRVASAKATRDAPATDAAAASDDEVKHAEEFGLQAAELAHLRPLRDALLAAHDDLARKQSVVDADARVVAFVAGGGPVARVLTNIDTEDAFLLKCVVAVGQAHILDVASQDPITVANALAPLVRTMRHVDVFYDMLGGVVGYQLTALELIHEQYGGPPPAPIAPRHGPDHPAADACGDAADDANYETDAQGNRGLASTCLRMDTDARVRMHVPVGPDLRENAGAFAARAAAWGLEELPRMAEVYPLGGAGDRLGLVDPGTGESLPAALLMYNGRTLIEGLLRDLTAREWLYYKLHGKQHVTPVAIMTSAAKGNHRRISALMRSHGWFGRGAGGFRLFEQPLVPVVTTHAGRWVPNGELNLALKPGGHGAIWKLMHDQGVFTWLAAKGRTGGVVRQITNPMAGTDTTLLALSGVGAKGDKALGFASCERHLGAAEGVNVLVEKQDARTRTWSYGISNVEYTVLQQHGISDEPVAPGSDESAFPANTNVLYIGLRKVQDALLSSPKGAFPGMLVNLSKPAAVNGMRGGRLETSMQNIADVLMRSSHGSPLEASTWQDLPTFVLYTLRRRVTSSAKKKRDPATLNLAQTPDGSFLDLLKNASDLLDRCGVTHPAPEGGTVQDYLDHGPGFIFCTLPAIGPLWDVIEQKIAGGVLADRAEVRLEVAELQWENVRVDGSLLVEAKAPLGGACLGAADGIEESGAVLVFDDAACGRCRLRDVEVANLGVDWSAPGNVVWSAQLSRHESCEITLHGDAELDAKGVRLEGNLRYSVPSGWRLKLRPDGKGGVAEAWTHLATAAVDADAAAAETAAAAAEREVRGCGGGSRDRAIGGRGSQERALVGPTWQWRYEMGEGSRVKLHLEARAGVAVHGRSYAEAQAAVEHAHAHAHAHAHTGEVRRTHTHTQASPREHTPEEKETAAEGAEVGGGVGVARRSVRVTQQQRKGITGGAPSTSR